MEMIGITERDKKILGARKWEVTATKNQNSTKDQRSYLTTFQALSVSLHMPSLWTL